MMLALISTSQMHHLSCRDGLTVAVYQLSGRQEEKVCGLNCTPLPSEVRQDTGSEITLISSLRLHQ